MLSRTTTETRPKSFIWHRKQVFHNVIVTSTTLVILALSMK